MTRRRCGKNYEQGSPVVPPGGEFSIPATSSSTLLAFRCAPAIKPYLPEDVFSPAGMLIDTYVTNSEIAGSAPISLSENGGAEEVVVSVAVNGQVITRGIVPLNATKIELPFSLAELTPQKNAYEVACTAQYASEVGVQRFEASANLSYLPDPTDGSSVVKMDLRTGALLAKPATGSGGDYQTVFPVGFYTAFADYLATNLSTINAAKEEG